MADNKENHSHFSDDDLRRLNVVGLKNYLRRHNQFVTSNKSDLLERAIGVGKLKLRDKSDQETADSRELVTRREAKLKTPLGEILPDPLTLKSGWTDNIVDIPDFSDRDVYNYLVLRMNAKRHLRAKVYYEDGHVHSVNLHQVTDSSSHCFVKSKVMPSLPTAKISNSPDHTVWLCMSKVTGQIHSADCSCTAGAGEVCNHVAALMYAVVDITTRKTDGTLASTSSKCKWSNPRKRKLSPKKAQDLKFRKYEFGTVGKAECSVASESAKESTTACIVREERFKARLLTAKSNAGWLTVFEETEAETETRKLSLDIDFQFKNDVDLKSEKAKERIQAKFDSLTMTEEECFRLEKETRGQSKSATWEEERKLRLTASNFGAVLKHKETSPAEPIIKRLLYTHLNNKYVAWGKKHEPAARMKYKLVMKRHYPDVKVRECGLFVNTEQPYLGASPDGTVKYTEDDVAKCGLLEIKCPASEKWKFLSPIDCCKDEAFYCELKDGKCCLKRSHAYYVQVQGQLGISDYKWCDFVIWTLAGISVERIDYDPDFWSHCSKRLEEFYIGLLLPKLLSSRIQRDLLLFSKFLLPA